MIFRSIRWACFLVSQFTISWVHLYLSRIIINILSYSDPSGLIQEVQKICKIILVQNTHIFVRTATEVMTAMEAMMMFFFRKRLTVHHRAEEEFNNFESFFKLTSTAQSGFGKNR